MNAGEHYAYHSEPGGKGDFDASLVEPLLWFGYALHGHSGERAKCLQGQCIQYDDLTMLRTKGLGLRGPVGPMQGISSLVMGTLAIPSWYVNPVTLVYGGAEATVGAGLLLTGAPILLTGYMRRTKAMERWMRVMDSNVHRTVWWTWQPSRYWERNLITDYFVPGTGPVAVALVAAMSRDGDLGFSGVPVGLCIVFTTIPRVPVGYPYRKLLRKLGAISVLPILVPVRGGVVWGVAVLI